MAYGDPSVGGHPGLHVMTNERKGCWLQEEQHASPCHRSILAERRGEHRMAASGQETAANTLAKIAMRVLRRRPGDAGLRGASIDRLALVAPARDPDSLAHESGIRRFASASTRSLGVTPNLLTAIGLVSSLVAAVIASAAAGRRRAICLTAVRPADGAVARRRHGDEVRRLSRFDDRPVLGVSSLRGVLSYAPPPTAPSLAAVIVATAGPAQACASARGSGRFGLRLGSGAD